MALMRPQGTSRSVGIIAAIIGIAAALLFAQPALAGGAPAVGTVPPVITVTGKAFDPFRQAPVVGAEVAFVSTEGGRPLATATSDLAGVYSVSLETGGKPLDVYVRATAAGRVTSLIFPPEPLTSDLAPCPPFAGTTGCILVAMLTAPAAGLVASFADIERDPTKGEVLFIAADCKGTPVAGATIAISREPERLVYTQGPFPNPAAQATDSSGRAFAFNIEPGRATVRARYPDGSIGVAHVLVEAGAITIASALPLNAQCGR